MATTDIVTHTPGPWHLAHDFDGRSRIWTKLGIDEDGSALGTFICAVDKRDGRTAEDLANARLITAAPELLAALDAAFVASLHDELECEQPWHRLAKAAIAKARGQQ